MITNLPQTFAHKKNRVINYQKIHNGQLITPQQSDNTSSAINLNFNLSHQTRTKTMKHKRQLEHSRTTSS